MHQIVFQDFNKISSNEILKGLRKKYNVIYYKKFKHLYDNRYNHLDTDLFIFDVYVDCFKNSNKIKMFIEEISYYNIPILLLTDPLFQCNYIKRYVWFIDLCFSIFKPLFYTKDFDMDVERAINSKRIKFNVT